MTAPIWVEEPPKGAAVAWQPNPGRDGKPNPQAVALASSADELFYGGAKGGAKTDMLIARPLYQVHRPLYAAAFVRQTFRELLRPLDRMKRVYSALPATQRPSWSGESKRWTFPSGAFVQLGYTEKGVTWAQGGNWAEILWDEMGNEPEESKLDALLSELRCPDPEVIRQSVGTGNPGFAGHAWTKKRYVTACGKRGGVAWDVITLPNGKKKWRCRQFVPATVWDNPTYANDEAYLAVLASLPERWRKCLLEGDYDAATGLAFDEVEERVHIRPAFKVPKHWPYMAGFDWGFVHNAVYVHARVSEDGRVYVVDTIKRRLMRDWDLAGVYEELVPIGARTNVHSGSDVGAEIKAREEQKSTQETFAQRGIHLVVSTVGRVHRYQNLMAYLSWRGSEYVDEREPMLQFFDTEGNRWLLEQLGTLTNDPDYPRDVLKVNANVETGEGGDDGYDALSVMLAQRPIVAESGFDNIEVGAFDAGMLRAAAERAAKGEPAPDRKRRALRRVP